MCRKRRGGQEPNGARRCGLLGRPVATPGRARLALGAVCACMLSACALYTPASVRVTPPRGPTQSLLVQTDPAGASCSLSQHGSVVAVVDATPGTASVPRRNASLEITCRKDGHLEARMRLGVLNLRDRLNLIEARPDRGPHYERTAADFAEYMGVNIAGALFPPAGIAWSIYLTRQDEEQNPPFAYRALPEILLTPAEFESAAARDAFFEAIQARLEAAADTQIASINRACRFWPCEPSTPACADPVCEQQRAAVTSQLTTQLGQMQVLRAQVRIGKP